LVEEGGGRVVSAEGRVRSDGVDVGAAVASRRVDKSVGGMIKVYMRVCECVCVFEYR